MIKPKTSPRIWKFFKPLLLPFFLLLAGMQPKVTNAQIDCSSASGILALMAAPVAVSPTDVDDFGGSGLVARCTTQIFRTQQTTTPSTCVSAIKMYVFYSNNKSDLTGLPTLASNGDFKTLFSKRNVQATMSNGANANEKACVATLSSTGLTTGHGVYYRWAKLINHPTDTDPMVWSNIMNMRNANPRANAGADRTVSLNQGSSITLTGSGTDDETVSSYRWAKVSGPDCTIATPTTASTSITGLVVGTYTFSLTVTDDLGATGSDNVIITVVSNFNPTVNAGTDKNMTLPTNSVAMTGSASDADGTVSALAWTRVSGPTTFTFSSTTTANPTVSGLVEGDYVFRLTATDNSGGTASDDVLVKVVAPVPVVNAGADQTIQLPTNSVTLTATATTPAGTITSRSWTKVSGPNAGTFTGTGTATMTASSLAAGTYTFVFSATNSFGKSAEDQVTVVVRPQPDLLLTVSNVFDGTVPNNTFANLCGNSSTVPKVSTIPDLTVSIREINNAAITTPFVVRITKGSFVKDTTINGIAALGTITFKINYTRIASSTQQVETRVCSIQSTQNIAICLRCGDGISGIAHWDDRGLSVKADQNSAITETNESNNTFNFQ